MDFPPQEKIYRIATLNNVVKQRLDQYLERYAVASDTSDIIDLSSELRRISELNRALARQILTAARKERH